jgi:flagellar protein FliS
MSLDPKREYREASVRSANSTGLVIMLYEAAIEDLQHIAAAIAGNDIQQRTDDTHHFLQVLNQLQGSLDMERGGEVAANLDRYYSLVRSQILQAELENSTEPIRRLLNQFLSLHQAWVEVDRTASKPAQTRGMSGSQTPAVETHEDRRAPGVESSEPVDWSA